MESRIVLIGIAETACVDNHTIDRSIIDCVDDRDHVLAGNLTLHAHHETQMGAIGSIRSTKTDGQGLRSIIGRHKDGIVQHIRMEVVVDFEQQPRVGVGTVVDIQRIVRIDVQLVESQ